MTEIPRWERRLLLTEHLQRTDLSDTDRRSAEAELRLLGTDEPLPSSGASYDKGFADGFVQALDDVEAWILDRGEEHVRLVLERIADLRRGAGEPALNVDWEAHEIRRLLAALADMGVQIDAVLPDGVHLYWSTHCRHGDRKACEASTIERGGGTVPKNPSQCKSCAAPCQHTEGTPT